VVLMIPSKTLDSNYLMTQLRSSSSTGFIMSGSRKVGDRPLRAAVVAAALTPPKPEARQIRSEGLRLRKEHPKKSLSVLADKDVLAAVETDEHSDGGSLTQFLRSKLDTLVLLAGKEEKPDLDLGWVADVKLTLSELKGTLLLEPELPWGEFHALVLDPGSGRS